MPDADFKVGEDDAGDELDLSLPEFVEYYMYNRDDNPLYVFQADLQEHPQAKALLKDYKILKFFEEDLFSQMLGERQAPPHRWFLMGPKRSGSEVHTDPLATSAWNASVTGRKRWVMFAPDEDKIDKWVAKGMEFMEKG
jgi:histone arginine demethylase JMJD6